MNTLVTGATGFVGANLVEALNRRGWQVRALRRKSSSLKALDGLKYGSAIGNVVEPESLPAAMTDVDVVFHVAGTAQYWRNGVETLYRVNVDGTRNVLQAALDAGVRRVVLTSSVAALGKPPFGQTLDERAQFNMRPQDFHYGYSKVLAERVVHEFVAQGLDVVIVNPVVVMGPRDVNLIGGSIITEAVKMGGIPVIPPGGVSMIDVEDACEGHIAAAERGKTGERYILGGENLWHAQIGEVVNRVIGRKPIVIRAPGFVLQALSHPVDWIRNALNAQLPLNGEQLRFSAETFWFDSSKARRELGLTMRPFEETARRTYEWYKANGYF
jgi:dihydroflavonol-4-reductase